MTRAPWFAAMALLVALDPPAAAKERVAAAVSCAAAGKPLVYDCVLTLTGRRSGRPVEGAEATVGADMPSMPMAHNVAPVKAEPAGKPGAYRFRLELEMHGEWALKIRLTKPQPDLIVHTMTFARPPAGHRH